MKKINLKNIDTKLILFLLLPFFVISVFNNPASDDFDFSFKTRDYGFWGAQVYRYMNEGGRYFAYGLLSLDPLVVKAYWTFKILPILVLSLFVFSVFYFFKNIFWNWNKKNIHRFILLFFLVYFSQLSEVCSAFYWFSGAMTCQLPTSLSLLFFGTFVRYLRTKSSKLLILLCILLVILLGCYEVVTIIYLVGVTIVGLYLKWNKKSIPYFYYLFFVVIFIASAFELLAPGNIARDNTIKHIVHKHEFFYTILRTGLSSLKFFFKWLPLLFFTALYCFPYFKNWKFLDLKFSFLIAFTTLFLGFFPGFWTGDVTMPERAQNTIYFFFIFSGLYFALVLIHTYSKKYLIDIQSNVSFNKLMFVGIFLLSFSNSPLYDVYNDLLTMKAYRYNIEMENRYKTIENSTENKLVFPALVNKPKTIYTEPIMGLTNSKYNWKNLELKEYYHKEIIIKPTDSIFIE